MRDQTVRLRLTEQELADLDAARGLVTRSAYLRSLIPGQPDDTEEEASQREDLIAPLAPGERHLHRFEPTGVRRKHPRLLRVTEDQHRCACGEEKWQ